MVDQVGVERVVARDEHTQGVATGAAGPPDLLPQRGPRARESPEEHGVQPGDVDAQLEGVGRRQTDEPTVAQRLLQRTAFLRKVAPAVRRHGVRERRVDLGEQPARPERDGFGSLARTHEGKGADVVDDQVGEQVGELRGDRAPHRSAVLALVGDEGRLPQGQRDLAARGGVVGHGHDRQAGQPARRDLGLRDCRRGEHERRVGAVQTGDATEPPDHLGHVGAEHAAVVVALVDDDVAQAPEEPAPPLVPGQQRPVQHVRVREHVLRVVAGPLPLLR